MMERFVVGTGRCGSTLLSNMLSCHPAGLVLSECLGSLDRLEHLESGVVSAENLTRMLRYGNPFVDMSIQRGSMDSEALLDASAARAASPPAWMIVTLPFLSDKPDQLFAEILAEVAAFPDQPLAVHYARLFAWLQKRLGKSFWIERSGESTVFLPKLFATFPLAKYVHIHRDGPDAVLSMTKHSYLSLATTFFIDPPTREELAETEYGGKPVSPNDPISRRFTHRPSLDAYAAYWNYQIIVAYRTFARMNPAQLLEVRFEDLVADPRQVLTRIAGFFEMPAADGWIEQAARMVDTNLIRSSTDTLSRSEREQLEKACETGRLLLGRREHPWVYPLLRMVKELEAEHPRSAL
jgi:Sulfotransferase family